MSSGLGKGKGQVSTCEKAIMGGGLVSQIQHGACCAGLHPSYWSPPQLVLGSHRKLWDKSPRASGCWVGEGDMNLGAQVLSWAFLLVYPAKTYSILNVGSSTLRPLALRLATPLSFPRCTFCWAELGKVFTFLILFLPSLPSIPLCFFPFLNHYHNLGFQTGSHPPKAVSRGPDYFHVWPKHGAQTTPWKRKQQLCPGTWRIHSPVGKLFYYASPCPKWPSVKPNGSSFLARELSTGGKEPPSCSNFRML